MRHWIRIAGCLLLFTASPAWAEWDGERFERLQWREIGPWRGGRSAAVTAAAGLLGWRPRVRTIQTIDAIVASNKIQRSHNVDRARELGGASVTTSVGKIGFCRKFCHSSTG